MSNHDTTPLVWVSAEEVVRCAQLAVDNWHARRATQLAEAIKEWEKRRVNFWSKKTYSREEATRLAKQEDPFWNVSPRWVEQTLLLGRAALLAKPEALLQLSPLQVSWLWPEIDPRRAPLASSNQQGNQ